MKMLNEIKKIDSQVLDEFLREKIFDFQMFMKGEYKKKMLIKYKDIIK